MRVVESDLASRERVKREVARRRTFAIISHPDAGKTTLTEKLLLYAGAVHLAGAIRARKGRRHVTSDWMAIERERGISITTTSLQFGHRGHVLNLLDTPGHQDFSEDTYRTLMAVDSAVMVLDAAKGVEPQTRKLFEVCRLRRLPILTFINKLDLVGRDPLDLLGEIERVLGVAAVPVDWPIGQGPTFQGVYHLGRRCVLRFSRVEHNVRPAPLEVTGSGDPRIESHLGHAAARSLREEIDLLRVAGARLDHDRYRAGAVTPVFFGSALNSFGVEPFLDALLDLAPPPGACATETESFDPVSSGFSGFIFKIQANMDPRHHDRMAFLRVRSGRFRKDMLVFHSRLGHRVRMSRPHRLFAQHREIVDEAFAGDVVGLINPGLYAIGDTLSEERPVPSVRFPRFPPERFAVLRVTTVIKQKQFQRGLHQLEEEGAIQVLLPVTGAVNEPILAAVGELQFDVVQARLRNEYGVDTTLERLPYTHALWVGVPLDGVKTMTWPYFGSAHSVDRQGCLVGLFASTREAEYCREKNPGVRFAALG